MKIAIHQPNYLPYIGFFQKMSMSDVFVLLDIVQFSKDSYTQRTKIRIKDGWLWLTIPIEKKCWFKPIMNVQLPDNDVWLKKHKMSLTANYSKCEHFDIPFLNEYYTSPSKFSTLQEFNEYGINYLKDKFGITSKCIRASELELELSPTLKSTDLLIKIIEKLDGNEYISGSGGRNYLDESIFSKHHIELKYFEFEPFVYHQRWIGFEKYMSAIDFVFNIGQSAPFQQGIADQNKVFLHNIMEL